jgi:hypothetical protein
MGDGVDLADGGEELVAEPFALRCAFHQPRDVDEGQPGRDDLRRFADLRQQLEPRIRHRHFAYIGLDGAEWVIRGLRRGGFGQCIEERRLAHVGQTDDAAFETHTRS